MTLDDPAAAAQEFKAGRRRLALAAAFSIGLHVALLARWPGLPQGGSIDRSAPTADVISARILVVPSPTVAAPARGPVPELPQPSTPSAATRAAPASPLPPPMAVPVQRAAPVSPAPTPTPPTPATATAPQRSAPVQEPSLPARPEYRGEGLDPPPRPLSDIEPEYPPGAERREGTVVLRLLIDAEGKLDEIAVVRSFPPGVFDSSALAAFGKAQYAPGVYRGKAVKSQITIAVDYTPTNRGSSVSGASN